MSSRPQNVGIKALEIYFPAQFVNQTELEKFMNVGAGKFTVGLGQTNMSFCDDREDIYSLALTTVSSLLRKYSIHPKSIGRLEVGTESMLDKSKSCKTVLMQLFEKHGNFEIDGVDTYNACYGGTNALFNAVNWIESSAWDGRDAIVIAGDIATYGNAAARPTGGAGCVAMLVGPNAPLAIEPGVRGLFMKHTYDFYKAQMTSEYPLVDGQFSIQCYTEAVDACYNNYQARRARLAGGINGMHSRLFIDSFDYLVFHAPTCKLVAKSYARMLYNDFLANPNHPEFESVPAHLRKMDYQRFAERVEPGLLAATQCGNMYTASVYASLVSLVSNVGSEQLQGRRIAVFSYGSGLASALFSLRVQGDINEMATKLELKHRLETRVAKSPEEYDEAYKLRERAYQRNNYTATGDISLLAKGTYHLVHVDDMFRRTYEIKA
ncbi:Hydroxymethylglutaryl-CoA synthase [Lasiodiplodia theobromae]|uniref:Hydroxymethylglutaryl-CoA synthase n=1 Tax=Lasiodiplodia theobromae TaxID=45133 RepID=UPI0015C391C3|nr:Hydroxymethylglutaryl-CoA synthase [Lasiodiplodia theobromae]KAF4540644.1 Hydroxymethylglutaryl-CoA synthase [Lasiodiplodia theobromae]